jgi:2-dehydropantoate 2-reductase
MRILILGAGAIGGYYGAELIAAGADVTFLVRERRSQQLRSHGLVVQVAGQRTTTPVRSVTAVPASESFDLVLMSCKTYDIEAAMDAVEPAVRAGAFVLPLLNGLSAYDTLDTRFGRDKVLGGVAYVAVSMDRDGLISRAGERDRLLLGARSPAGERLANRLIGFFGREGAVRSLSDTIAQALWNKWVMIAAGAALTCLMRGSVKDILASPGGESLMKRAISECAAVAAASGYAVPDEAMRQIDALLLDRQSPWAASMMRDIAAGAPRLESAAVLGDMVGRATSHALDATVLSCAFCHTQVYESHSAGAASI